MATRRISIKFNDHHVTSDDDRCSCARRPKQAKPRRQDVCDDGHVETPGAMIRRRLEAARQGDQDRLPKGTPHGHTSHIHIHTERSELRNAAGPHVHQLTPAPNHTQIPIPSPIQHTMAAERAVGAVSEPSYLTGTKTINQLHRRAVGMHTRVDSGS